MQGVVRYRYACSQVPLKGTETRQFGLWLAPPPSADEPFGKSIDSFFRLMLPDVPPGPKWQHEIAMVYYDFLSEDGQGWEKDVNELARLLKPEERRRVALCFHGWYESLGGYSYDDSTGKMKTEWTAMGRTRKVHLTQEEMKRRLRVAKQLGFRVMLYFGDGMIQDSKSPIAGLLPSRLGLPGRERKTHHRLGRTGHLGHEPTSAIPRIPRSWPGTAVISKHC